MELGISQVSPVGVGQFDLLSIVDTVEAVIAVVILHPGKVPFDEVIFDLRDGRYIGNQNALAAFDPVDPIDRAVVQMQKITQGGFSLL